MKTKVVIFLEEKKKGTETDSLLNFSPYVCLLEEKTVSKFQYILILLDGKGGKCDKCPVTFIMTGTSDHRF